MRSEKDENTVEEKGFKSFEDEFSKPHPISSMPPKKILSEEERETVYYEYIAETMNKDVAENLAYIMGAVLGDGCHHIDKKGYHHIAFAVTDKPFFDSVKATMEKVGLRTGKEYKLVYDNPKKKDSYSFSFQKRIFGEFFEDLNLIRFLKTRKMKIAFVKGFHEAEGSVYPIYRKNHIYKGLKITNTKLYLIDLVESILREFGFTPRAYRHKYIHIDKYGVKHNGIMGRLVLCKQKEIERFLDVFRPCIKNKPRADKPRTKRSNL